MEWEGLVAAPAARPPAATPSELANELDAARFAVGALRKTDIHVLRDCRTPLPEAAAVVELVTICIGAELGGGPQGDWESVRRVMSDPAFTKKVRDRAAVTHVSKQHWRRLHELIRISGSAEPGQLCTAASALRRWAVAAVNGGAVVLSGTRPQRRREPCSPSSEPAPRPPPPPPEAPSLPDPASPPDAPQPDPSLPGHDDSDAALQELREKLAQMEQELMHRDTLLQQLREERQPQAHVSSLSGGSYQSPQPATPMNSPALDPAPTAQASFAAPAPQEGAGGGVDNATQQTTASWLQSGGAPRRERQPVTTEQARALRQNEWRRFCRAAGRELHERDLQRVTYDTLIRLLSLYNITCPVSIARIEIAWREAQGIPLPDPPPPPPPPPPPRPMAVPPRLGSVDPPPLVAHPLQRRKAARRSLSAGAVPRHRREQPLTATPETAAGGKQQVTAARAADCSAGLLTFSPDRTMMQHGIPPQGWGASCSVDNIGPPVTGGATTPRHARVGRADPNTLSPLPGTATLDEVQRSELRVLASPGGTQPAVHHRRGAGAPHPSCSRRADAAPSNPNATNDGASPAELAQSPVVSRRNPNELRAGQERMQRVRPCGTPPTSAGCDPNTASSPDGGGIRGLRTAARGRLSDSPPALRARGARAPPHLTSSCDPNQACTADTTKDPQPQRASGLSQTRDPNPAYADPNSVSGAVGPEQRRRAERQARADGDSSGVFSPTTAPTAPCDPNLGHSAAPGRFSGRATTHTQVGRPGEECLLTNTRKGRHAPEPAARSGHAAHPLHGTDPLVVAGPYSEDGSAGGVLGRGVRGPGSRARADASGCVRQDEVSERQVHSVTSPPSRRRFLPPQMQTAGPPQPT